MNSSKARAALAGGLVFLAGLAWLALSVFRATEFSPTGRSPSLRALSNPFYVFALALLLAIGVRAWRTPTQRAEPFPPENKQAWLWGAVLLLLLLLATHAGSLSLSPLSDDFNVLLQARHATPASYWKLFTRGQGGIMFRPLGLSLLLGEYHLWGLAPEGYRGVNLLLHLAAALGLAALAGDLGLGRATAWTAAALFALHPVHPESTVWIVSLVTVQAGACLIWSLHFYLRYRREPRRSHLILSLALAAAGMLSKEQGYVLPLLVLAHDVILVEPSESWRQRFRQWFPYAALLVAGLVYRVVVLGGVGGYPTSGGVPAFLGIQPLKMAEALLLRAPALSLLAINWSLPLSWLLKVLAALAVLVLAAVVGWSPPGAVSARRFAFLLAWIVLTALPAHFLLLVGGDLLGTRNLYLPPAAGALLLAMVVTGPGAEGRRRALSTTAVLVLLALYVAALQHNLRAWTLASQKTEQILGVMAASVPQPPPGARFWVLGLPDQANGVYLHTVGLTPMLNLRYGRKDLQSQIFARPADLPRLEPGTFLFRWNVPRQELEAVKPGDL